uniref:Uncharacterized protein n=1 Tax=Ascaris lumbricoides TaxID=6252 RepID=A0A0M3I148_ASCLU
MECQIRLLLICRPSGNHFRQQLAMHTSIVPLLGISLYSIAVHLVSSLIGNGAINVVYA